MSNDQKVQLIIEAFDKFSPALKDFQKQLSDMERQHKESSSRIAGYIKTIKDNWLGASAAIYAAQATFSTAWEKAFQAAEFEERMDVMNRYLGKYGQTADEFLAKIKKISEGLLSNAEIADIATSGLMKKVTPEQIELLTKGAILGAKSGRGSEADNLRDLVEGVSSGRLKSIQKVLGGIDLEDAYGEQLSKMNQREQMSKALEIIEIRINNLIKEQGESEETVADKMKQRMVSMKDHAKDIGDILIRGFYGAYAVMEWLSAGALTLYSYFLKVQNLFLWISANNPANDPKTREAANAAIDSNNQDIDAANKAAQALTGSAADKMDFATRPKTKYSVWKGGSPPEDEPGGKKNDAQARKDAIEANKLALQDRRNYLKESEGIAAEMMSTLQKTNELGYENMEITEQQYYDNKFQLERDALEQSIAYAEEEKNSILAAWNERKGMYREKAERDKDTREVLAETGRIEADIAKKREQIDQRGIDQAKQNIQLTQALAQAKREGELRVLEAQIQLQTTLNNLEVQRGTMSRQEASVKAKELEIGRIQKEIANKTSELDTTKEASKRQQIATDIDALTLSLQGARAELADLQLQLNGGFFDGLARGFRQVGQEMSNAFQNGLDAAREIASGMQDAFMGFFDYTSDQFMKFGTLAKNILNSIYKAMMQALVVKPLTNSLMGGLGGIFGSLFGGGGSAGGFGSGDLTGGMVGFAHSGGHITSRGVVPRFHFGGLLRDEVPAILQTGEGVLSRRGMKTLDALNDGRVSGGSSGQSTAPQYSITINALDASSFIDMCRRNPSAILTPVLESFKGAGAMRDAVKGV